MAKNDILVRWKADTGNYDANIAKARRQLDGFAKDNLSAGGAMKQLTQSVVGAATKFASLAAAGKLAMETIKGAFNATERSADALASTQMQLNSVIDSFFRTLNDGSFTTFLSGLSDVATRAREAYEAMDELSSFAVRYNPKNQADMQRIDKLLKEARALQAKGDKAGAAAKTEEATAIANQARANTLAYGQREYNAGMATLKNLLGQSGTTFSDSQIMWYSDPKNFDEANRLAKTYEKIIGLQKSMTSGPMSGQAVREIQKQIDALGPVTPKMARAYAYMNTRDTAGTEKGDMFIKATEQIYGKQRAEYAADAIQARIDRAYAVATKTTGGGTTTPAGKVAELPPEGSILAQEQLVADLTKKWKNATDQVGRDGYLAELEKAQKVLENMTSKPSANPFLAGDPSKMGVQALALYDIPESAFEQMQAGIREQFRQLDLTTLTTLVKVSMENGIRDFDGDFSALREKIGHGMLITDEEWLAFQESFNEKLQSLGLEPIKLNLDTGGLENVTKETKKMGDSWQSAAQAIQAVGSAMSAIEDPAAKVAGTIAEAIASIALGAGQAIASHGGRMENGGPWAWLAFAAATTATMITTIASIRKATSHAEGGIIPGNNLSGDNRLAWVNSGEVVLNAAQSDTLAAKLQGSNPLENMTLTAKVAGKDLVLAINNSQIGRNQGTLKFH